MKLQQLNIYPIKSTRPISLSSVHVRKHSFLYDREWGLFGEDGQVITGRTHPQLLDIQCKIGDTHLHIFLGDQEVGKTLLKFDSGASKDFKIFSYVAHGYTVSRDLDIWLSDFLKTTVRFVHVNLSAQRPVLAKHGGEAGDIVGFGDQAPILILSQASQDDLNSRLDHPIGTNRFRPNIVVDDCAAYEEDRLKNLTIGDCTFKIIQPCERCVFTTIDPLTKNKHPKSEPLKTLATYRKGPRGGVIFGVHAVPLNEGVIAMEDDIKVTYR